MGTRRTRLLFGLAAVAVLAAACAGDDDDDASSATSTTAVSAVSESRFTGDDSFCQPADEDPSETPTASDDGITESTVSLANVRLKLEDLETIGFGLDNGDTADQAQAFIDIINDECGGIHGRLLELETIELAVPGLGPTDPEVEAQAACTAIAEDHQAVAAFSNTGAGNPIASCLTGPNDVIFLTTYDLSRSDFDAAEGRLFSMNHSPTDILTHAVRSFADELEGKTIGVVHGDNAPDPQIVQDGLVAALEEIGVEAARVDALGCNGGSPCTDGVIESAQGMRADGVDVIFPLLDTVTLPTYVGELVTQGYEPGSVQFFNTSFLAQDSELVTGKLVEFGGESAGALYDGTRIVSGSRAGEHRLDDFEPDPFVTMCNREYAAHTDVISEPYDVLDDDGNRKSSSVAGHCAQIRIIARAIEAAGPNPTRADIAAALTGLGEVDSGEGIPSSFAEGKYAAPDAIVRETFHYPCPLETTNSVGNCIVPETDFLPVPES